MPFRIKESTASLKLAKSSEPDTPIVYMPCIGVIINSSAPISGELLFLTSPSISSGVKEILIPLELNVSVKCKSVFETKLACSDIELENSLLAVFKLAKFAISPFQ